MLFWPLRNASYYIVGLAFIQVSTICKQQFLVAVSPTALMQQHFNEFRCYLITSRRVGCKKANVKRVAARPPARVAASWQIISVVFENSMSSLGI